jgi:hypothetical protein
MNEVDLLKTYGPWGLLLLMYTRETLMLSGVRRELSSLIAELRELVRVLGQSPGGR